jgi:hypothetical protein
MQGQVSRQQPMKKLWRPRVKRLSESGYSNSIEVDREWQASAD